MSAKAEYARQELIRQVRYGEVRSHEGLKIWKLQQAGQWPGQIDTEQGHDHAGAATPTRHGGTCTQAPLVAMPLTREEEVFLNRTVDGLLEAYRRLSRPDKVGKVWASDRWALLSQVLGKLRTLANAARWSLPPPARATSKDPKALAETGMEDPQLAAVVIDNSEGLVEARITRIAVHLIRESQGERKKNQKGTQSWLSQEAITLAKIVLCNLRSAGSSMERLIESDEPRETVLIKMEQVYGALAAALASFRQRVGEEAQQLLSSAQDPLLAAAKAACSLGLVVPAAQNRKSSSRAGWAALKQAVFAQHKETRIVGGDTFTPLHQATLLASISSFAKVNPESPRGGGGGGGRKSDQELRVQRLVDSLLNGREDGSNELANPSANHPTTGNSEEPTEMDTFPVEFTQSQLRQMRKALKNREPQVAGALAYLEDTINSYNKLADAVGSAYGDEKQLRANPPEVNRHKVLVQLSAKLHSAWKDAGIMLTPSCQADLLALEQVRIRHKKLVLRAFRTGGHEVAALVLARLALVDEMMMPNEEDRRLTGKLPWASVGPYELCQSVVSGMGKSVDDILPRRRRRWLRCPHATTQVILAGEVWSQMMRRFLTCETAFEPFNACADLPLSFREFRTAASLMELSLHERLAIAVYEVAENSGVGGNGEATLTGLQKMVLRYGPRGCGGEFSKALDSAATAARLSISARYSEGDSSKGRGPRRTSFAAGLGMAKVMAAGTAARRSSGIEAGAFLLQQNSAPPQEPKVQPTLMVCPRCLRGEVPNFPHVSVGELARQQQHVGAEETAPPPPPPKGSVNATRKTPNKADAEHLGSSSDSDSDSSSDDDPYVKLEASQEMGEDTVLAWAISVLAQNLLLTQDERGQYFRWLARIVLYNTSDVLAEEGKNARSAASAIKRADVSGSSNRRASFASMLFAAATPDSGIEQLCRVPSKPKKSTIKGEAAEAIDCLPHSLAAAGTPSVSDSAAMVAEQRAADEQEEMKEAERDNALELPDALVFSMRVDLGMQGSFLPLDEEYKHASPRKSSKERVKSLQERRNDLTNRLIKLFKDRFLIKDNLKVFLSEREARVAHALRFLGVSEREVGHLQKEIAFVRESTSNLPTAPLLKDGAAELARKILLPNPALKVPVSREKDQDSPYLALQTALRKMREKESGRGDQLDAAVVGQDAQEIVVSSSQNASKCYGRAGFEEEARKSRVAVALRLLEHELTASTAEEGPENEDELVSSIAPLLLPKDASQKLMKQAQREEEQAAAEAAAIAEAMKAKPEANGRRRKARVAELTHQSLEDSGSDEDSARSDIADTGSPNRRGNKRHATVPPSMMLTPTSRKCPQQPNSPLSRAQTPLKPQTPIPLLSSEVAVRASATAVGMQVPPGISDDRVNLEAFNQNPSYWHPSVISILENVDKRKDRVKSFHYRTRTLFDPGMDGTKSMMRVSSDSAISKLPRVDNVSPLRGGKPSDFKSRRRQPNRVLVEGWRAKVPEPGEGARRYEAQPLVERSTLS
eukprot:TRINITY_DN5631_c1_g1_i1.p1 TRINITY_DN5631_c1_g1~~TRINITY_DN5631_c1_g1_i1.p1  ORF type:complete len:1509 (+),score=336.48 TRINITY_DN5631_c1_g1_i1:66-4592(+)